MNKFSKEYIAKTFTGIAEKLSDFSNTTFDSSELLDEMSNEVFTTNEESEASLLEYGVFSAIKHVSKFENENFGSVFTDFTDSVQVANGLFFVLASELIDEAIEKSLGKLYIETAEELQIVNKALNSK